MSGEFSQYDSLTPPSHQYDAPQRGPQKKREQLHTVFVFCCGFLLGIIGGAVFFLSGTRHLTQQNEHPIAVTQEPIVAIQKTDTSEKDREIELLKSEVEALLNTVREKDRRISALRVEIMSKETEIKRSSNDTGD